MTDNPQLLAQAQKKHEERQRCRADKMYLAEVMGYDFCEDVHRELFDCYPAYDAKKPWADQTPVKNRLILWPRGHFKSTSIIVEIFSILLAFPDSRILIMQGGLGTTRKLLAEIAAHLTGTASNSRFQELFPEYCGVKHGETWHFGKKIIQLTANGFTVPNRVRKQLQAATLTVASPNSITTSQHYDAMFFDDIVHSKNYRSAVLLEKARADYDMFAPLLDPGGLITVTGTRYAIGDAYQVLAERAALDPHDWLVSIKTCWAENGRGVRFPKRKTKDGQRWIGITREELLTKQLNDPGVFCSQYLNQPVSAASQVFTRAFIESALITPTPALLETLSQPVLFVDLASSTGERSDDAVIIAGRLDPQGRMYVSDIRGGKWIPSQFALHVIDMALRHRPLMILFEKSASSAYFVALLRDMCQQRKLVLPMDFLPANTNSDAKYTRIAQVESHIRAKRLFFFKGLEPWERLVTQFEIFPAGKNKHDDYPDTVALMCVHFSARSVFVPPMDERKRFLHMIEQYSNPYVAPEAPKATNGDEMGDDFTC